MVQVLPQVQIFQELTPANNAIVAPLRALILGPHYAVRTYAKAKSLIGIGAYDASQDTDYSYPAREAGEIVDLDYVRVFLDEAMIRYFEDDSSGGQTFTATAPNYVNLGGASSLVDLTSYSRLAALPKDVEAGDYIKVTNPNDLADHVTSEIRQVLREEIPGTFAAATSDALNQADAANSTTLVTSPASSNYTPTASAVAYDGSVSGHISERYTVTITKSGPANTAEMNIISDSGLDNVYGQVITALSTELALGTRGATISFAGSGNFVAGTDEWVIDVTGDFAETDPPTTDTARAYTGATDTTYIVEVIRGGSSPRVSVRTTTGIDGVETDITLQAWNKIGNKGLYLYFGDDTPAVGGSSSSSSGAESSSSSSSGGTSFGYRLCAGDQFHVVATAATQGRAYQLLLAESLTATIIAEADLNVEIYAKRNIEVTQQRYTVPGVTNFDPAASQVTLNAGITYYGTASDPINGEPVVSGTAYVGYRALSQDHVGTVKTISDVALLGDHFDDVSPENPLGFGVRQALLNAGGAEVKYLAVATDDLAGYTAALEKTLERADVYSLVPLTADTAILNTVRAHVSSQSTPEKGRWRIAWTTQELPTVKRLVGDDDTPLTGTITQYSGDTVGVYRQLDLVGADFITNGVKAGDEVRYNYGTDAFGAATYTTAVIDTVISESRALILTGLSVAVGLAVKMEVWRTLSSDEQVDELIAGSTAASRRYYNVLGGNPDMDGYTSVADHFLAAAYAGLRSGVPPHQGLTNVELLGVTAIDYLADTLTATQLNELMNAGFWLTSQDVSDGSIYCRKQISTDVSDLNTTEQSVTTNLDSQSYYYATVLAPYYGKVNNVPGTRALIEAQMEAAFQLFSNSALYPTLGGQITTATITEFRQHATLKDRAVMRISEEIPYPLNNLDIYVVV